MKRKMIFLSLILGVALSGCGDQNDVATLFSDVAAKTIKNIPEIENRVGVAIDSVVGESGKTVDWQYLQEELMAVTSFESGFYQSHSPMRRSSGLQPLDELLVLAQKMRDMRLQPSNDINGTMQQIIEASLAEQFGHYGFSESQIIEILEN